MKKYKKYNLVLGDILRIDLGDGFFSFSRVLKEPLMAFYDLRGDLTTTDEEILAAPILFKVWVMNDVVTSGRWKVLGNRAVEGDLLKIPDFFKIDPITKRFSIYRDALDIPATAAECEGLERAAVWSGPHIESRLRDHFKGVSNKWVTALNRPVSD